MDWFISFKFRRQSFKFVLRSWHSTSRFSFNCRHWSRSFWGDSRDTSRFWSWSSNCALESIGDMRRKVLLFHGQFINVGYGGIPLGFNFDKWFLHTLHLLESLSCVSKILESLDSIKLSSCAAHLETNTVTSFSRIFKCLLSFLLSLSISKLSFRRTLTFRSICATAIVILWNLSFRWNDKRWLSTLVVRVYKHSVSSQQSCAFTYINVIVHDMPYGAFF